MRLQLAITVDECGTHDVAVCDIIVGAHTHVVAHAVHPALSGLVGELGEEGVAINDITEALGLIDTAANISTVVEAIAAEEVPAFQAVVTRKASAIHPRITTSNVDCTVETLALVLLQDDVDDACRAFGIVAHRRVGDDLDAFDHVALQGAQSILGAHAR